MSSPPYKIVGVLGLLVVLAAGVPQLGDLPPGSTRSLGVILAVLSGCFLTLALSRERGLLFGNLSLFVPLGWAQLFVTLLGLSAQAGALAFVMAARTVSLWGLSLPLSIAAVGIFFAFTLSAVWTSLLVLRATAGEPVRDVLAETFRQSFSKFWRGFAVLLVGHSVVMLLTLLLVQLLNSTLGLALVLMAAASLAWNLLTAPLLLTVVATDCSLTEAWAQSCRHARRHTREWLWPLVAQLVLTGFIVYLHVSWGSSFNRHTATQVKVSLNWMGGYPDESGWLSEYVEMLEIEPVALAATVLQLALFAVALIVKLRVASTLTRDPQPSVPASV